jgi:hypothetical protein
VSTSKPNLRKTYAYFETYLRTPPGFGFSLGLLNIITRDVIRGALVELSADSERAELLKAADHDDRMRQLYEDRGQIRGRVSRK